MTVIMSWKLLSSNFLFNGLQLQQHWQCLTEFIEVDCESRNPDFKGEVLNVLH